MHVFSLRMYKPVNRRNGFGVVAKNLAASFLQVSLIEIQPRYK